MASLAHRKPREDVDVRSTDKVPEYTVESERVGETLSRRHPQVKAQFEARQKELEKEIAESLARFARTQSPGVASGTSNMHA